MRVGRALAAAFGGAGVVGCAYVSSDPARREHVSGTLTGLGRFSRTLYYGARAAADYKFVLGPAEARLGVASEEYQALRKVIDQRNADRMLYVCKLHAAFYTKIGQYISTLNHALPPEYTSTLAELQDKARFRPWEDMERVLIEDFGKPSSELFASIETTPIAAASLAQVHRAVAHDGTKLAVKIQYPDLRRMAQNDLASMKILFELVEVLFPDYGFVWLFPEFKSTVAAEINFLQEARNGERVAAQFADDKRFHIPFVRRDLTTDRVLSMELIEGAKVSDKAWMKARRVDPSAVASSVVDFFASQVHEKGMVHCDPHPGNLMLRDNPDKSYGAQPWQLVVIDHGMYRRLTPQFRSAYCRLWRAVLLQDEVEGGAACVGLGLRADEYDAMSLILTNRPAKSKNGIGARMTKKDAMETWDKYGRVTVGDVNRFMQRLPRDLLFVSRNANLVRSLNMDLGGTSRDRFKAHGRAAVAGLVLNDALARAGIDLRAWRAASSRASVAAAARVLTS